MCIRDRDVMEYLIENVWYWRARLVVDSLVVDGSTVNLAISNLGRASTANATLVYISEEGEEFLPSISSLDKQPCFSDVGVFNYSLPGCGFGVNATNSSQITLDFGDAKITDGGQMILSYQKRVIDSSQWVSEEVNGTLVRLGESDDGSIFGDLKSIPSPSVILSLICLLLASFKSRRSEYLPRKK